MNLENDLIDIIKRYFSVEGISSKTKEVAVICDTIS